MRFLIPVGLALLVSAKGEEFTVEALKEGAPAEVADAIRKEMAPAGTRVLRGGKPFIDVWFRAAVPTGEPRQGLGILYGEIRQGGVVGAVRFHAGSSDYKNQKFPAGVYTLRYGLQPEDGDHQGTADNRDFLLLCQAAGDASPDPIAEPKELHKLSAKVNGKKHPAVLYLVRGPEGAAPRIVRDDPAERVMLEVDVPASGGKHLRMWIVIVGKAPE